MPRRTKADIERGRLCRHPGCTLPWVSTFGPFPSCLKHQRREPEGPPKIPTTPPVKSWAEPKEGDE